LPAGTTVPEGERAASVSRTGGGGPASSRSSRRWKASAAARSQNRRTLHGPPVAGSSSGLMPSSPDGDSAGPPAGSAWSGPTAARSTPPPGDGAPRAGTATSCLNGSSPTPWAVVFDAGPGHPPGLEVSGNQTGNAGAENSAAASLGGRPGGEERHAVRFERRVVRDEGEVLGQRLGHQHAVERVAVMRRQPARRFGVLERDRQRFEPLVDDGGGQTVRHVELAERHLDRRFPDRGGADRHEFGAVGDPFHDRLVEPGTRQPPQHDTGVEEETHEPSKAAMTVSGVASKSDATRTRPFHRPGVRRPGASASGPSRATGRPARPMITSSPAATRSSSRDSCVLA